MVETQCKNEESQISKKCIFYDVHFSSGEEQILETNNMHFGSIHCVISMFFLTSLKGVSNQERESKLSPNFDPPDLPKEPILAEKGAKTEGHSEL